MLFIRNRQGKSPFFACGAAIKWHFIVQFLYERKRNPPKGAPPLDPVEGPRPPRPPTGAFAPWTPFPPFGNIKFVTTKM